MNILELFLQTNQLKAQRQFYTEVLGLSVVDEVEGQWFAVQIGGSRLIFQQAADNGIYHFALNIPSNQFAEAKTWVSHRLPLITDNSGADEFDFRNWNAHAVYFYDPAGNIVELIARHNLNNDAERPFDPQSLLCISEVGLATEDVPAFTQRVRSQLGIQVYRRSESKEFTAVGDENGLLIAVKAGRVWYPDTGKIAQLLPITVRLTTPTGTQTIQLHPKNSTQYSIFSDP